jgi:hypothetical protein
MGLAKNNKINRIQSEIAHWSLFLKPSMGSRLKVKRTNRKEPFILTDVESVWPRQELKTETLEERGFTVICNDTYSRRSKQTAKHYTFTVNVPYGYRFHMLYGVPTFLKEDYDRNKVQPAIWFETGRGYTAKKVHGYIYKGYHVKAKSRDKAFKKVNDTRRIAAHKLRQSRIDRQRLRQTCRQTFLGQKHLKQVGACDPGIKEACRKLDINPEKIGGIRADILAEYYPSFAKKAVIAKTNKK